MKEIVAQLTAPGAPFEFEDAEIRGMQCRVFKDSPQYLSELYRNLKSHSGKTMAVYEGRRLEYDDGILQAANLAHYLKDTVGISGQQHVAIAMRNCPEWITAFIAVTSIGAVAVLVNSRGTADDIAYCVKNTDCDYLITDSSIAPKLGSTEIADLPNCVFDLDSGALSSAGQTLPLDDASLEIPEVSRGPEDPAIVIFTSGTTGRPKGAVLTHQGLMTGLKTNQFSSAVIGAQMAAKFGIDLATLAANRPQSSTLLMFPLFHVSGCLSIMIQALVDGGKIVMLKKWDATQAMQFMEAEKVTAFPGVPTMHWDLLQVANREDYDLSNLSSVSVAGQAISKTMLQAVSEAFPNCVLGTGYGMTEANGAVTLTIGEDLINNPTSAGKKVATTEIAIMNEDDEVLPTGEAGEICLRGATIMQGYYNQDEANAKCLRGGWYHSGDVGYLDEDGRLYIVDRQTDMIISSGENIYCAEVERVLLQHEAVHETVTFGIPDDRLGEKLIALVRLRDGKSASAEEIVKFAAEHLASYKIPGETLIIDQPIPRNDTSKAMKPQSREMYFALKEKQA